jgi:NADPH:quinone reductase-like Zn-dependent oxidoreductase
MHQYGDADVLVYEDAPLPMIDADEVLIKVHSAAINPADWQFRYGHYRDFAPRNLPLILGWDVAGIVQDIGAATTRFKSGDQVFAMADMNRDGAYAEYIAVKAEYVATAPKSLSLSEAAGVPLAALTAWQAVFDHGQVAAGQTVLVHGGCGGVGMFAVQFAHQAGAYVITTASHCNAELARSLGADRVIDYRKLDFSEHLRDVDLVVDTIGGETREKSWGVLRYNGMLAAVAMPPPETARAIHHGVRAAMIAVQANGIRLQKISDMIDAGKLRVLIDRAYPLHEAAAAHRYSESRHARGKLILRVN